ncbi:MAG TPA: alpha/beta hydrolase [Gammaproteobacteria bacterium]
MMHPHAIVDAHNPTEKDMRGLLFAFIISFTFAAPLSAASVDGIAIHSSAVGTGPTIVFVHGWTCDSSSWVGQVPAFASEYRVITLDLPGHGQSQSPRDGKFSMDLFARAVEAVRADANAERIVLVGHSMGVPVIRRYALSYPDRVAGLVAVDGPLDMRGPPPSQLSQGPPPMTGPEGLATRESLIRTMFVPETPVALQEQILSMMLGAPETTAAGAMAAMFDPSIRSADVVQAPALAIYAGTARVPDAQATKEIFPNYESTQVAGTGHFLMMEKPEEFNRLLTAFLERIQL